jgi:hypothetical protein
MKILVACEFSGTVRDAFIRGGHEAWSCDLLPSEKPGNHYQGNVLDIICDGWDLMVAHPPCTFLTVAANKWMKPEFADRFPDRPQQRKEAVNFFMAMINAPIPQIAVENPIGVISSRYRKPDQVVQPWMFGHGETKATCLWLKGLPRLIPTHIDGDLFAAETPPEREQRLHNLPPSPTRWMERSKTFQGIADAMATQWGNVNKLCELESV